MIKLFHHYIRRLSLLLAVWEALLFFALILLAAIAPWSRPWSGVALLPVDLPEAAAFAAWIVPVSSLMMGATGLYNPEVMFDLDAVVARLALSFSLAFAALFGLSLMFSPLAIGSLRDNPRAALLIPLCALLSLAIRGIFGRLARRQSLKSRVLVVGCGRSAAKIARLDRKQLHPFQVVGYVDFGNESDQVAPAPLFAAAAIATPDAALALIKAHAVDEIVIATDERRGLPHQSLLECRLSGTAIEDFASFWERHAAHLDLDSLQPGWLTYSDGFSMNQGRQLAKAGFDFAIAALLLLATAPITLMTALLIKLTSKGPIFFRQERVGRHGKVFTVLKFRSMTVDAEMSGPQWAKTNDARVTMIGRFIRKVRIDEIPQVINLLRGEMSFVGPRPERPFFVQQLSEAIPYFKERHRVKPGLSGWAQVNYPYGASVEDARNKLAYDLYYLKNGTLFLDFLVLLRTVHVVLWPFGAR